MMTIVRLQDCGIIRHVTESQRVAYSNGLFQFEVGRDIYSIRGNGYQETENLDSIYFADELVKEYLAFRGLTASLSAFESERKKDKLKGYQVVHVPTYISNLPQATKLVEQIFSYLQQHQFAEFRELWRSFLLITVSFA